MPDIPDAAIAAAESAIRGAFPGEFGKPGMPEPDALARAALEAAAPVLAEAWGVASPEVRPAPELARRVVLRVACSKCGSGTGEQCRSGTNRPVESHSARFAAAKRMGLFRDFPEASDERR